jgi:hypothetical protein
MNLLDPDFPLNFVVDYCVDPFICLRLDIAGTVLLGQNY